MKVSEVIKSVYFENAYTEKIYIYYGHDVVVEEVRWGGTPPQLEKLVGWHIQAVPYCVAAARLFEELDRFSPIQYMRFVRATTRGLKAAHEVLRVLEAITGYGQGEVLSHYFPFVEYPHGPRQFWDAFLQKLPKINLSDEVPLPVVGANPKQVAEQISKKLEPQIAGMVQRHLDGKPGIHRAFQLMRLIEEVHDQISDVTGWHHLFGHPIESGPEFYKVWTKGGLYLNLL